MIPKSINHLTIAQKECLIQAYKVLKYNYEDGDWFRDSAKRAVTRAFYMQCKSFKTGLISNAAWLYKLQGNDVCFDHCFIPQAYCFYIMAHWDTIGKSLETFFPHWMICSLGIDVTSEENKSLSKYTVNNKSTGNLLKVKVALIDRYKEAGIQIMDAETAEEVDFSVIAERLDEGFSEWEKMELLID